MDESLPSMLSREVRLDHAWQRLGQSVLTQVFRTERYPVEEAPDTSRRFKIFVKSFGLLKRVVEED